MARPRSSDRRAGARFGAFLGARPVSWLAAALLAGCGAAADVADSGTARLIAPSADLWSRALAAEDARGRGADGIAPLLEAARTDNPALRAIAVRGLGRLERADLVETIAPLLGDPAPAVRAQAANALGQAVLHADAAAVRALLREALPKETDGRVRGVMAETLGRLALPAPVAGPGGEAGSSGGRAGGAVRGDPAGGTEAGARPAEASAGSGLAIAAEDAATLAGLAMVGDSLTRLGAVKGLYFLSRQRLAGPTVLQHAGDALRTLAMSAPAARAEGSLARARRLAVRTLVAAGRPEPALIERWSRDDDPLLRREAALALSSMAEGPERRRLLALLLVDRASSVRYQALLQLARGPEDVPACAPVVDALGDGDPNVVLLAIDLLGTCEPASVATATLDSIASAPDAEGWHDGAHAIVALATRDPVLAAAHLPALARHESPFARAYAARAATLAGDVATLRALAADAEPNVRTAAVAGLSAVEGHAADEIYLAQLRRRDARPGLADVAATGPALPHSNAADSASADASPPAASSAAASPADTSPADGPSADASRADSADSSLADASSAEAALAAASPAVASQAAASPADVSPPAAPSADAPTPRSRIAPDPQLMMAVAAALEGGSHPDAPGTLLDALDRLTAGRWQTARDARVALLDRVRTLGGPGYVERVRAYVRDFDPRVAELAADVIGEWTGTRPEPAPRPLPPEPAPTFDEVAALEQARVVFQMEGGGEIVVRLRPFVAPTNAVRFARLAAAGGFDGLTIHRVVPNFVVQGGSPGANEYSGAGPFSRDELGLVGNWRGTVGLSTRGRDTGDAQFYINLVDNVRLDHQYTTFGVVVAGMDVVGRLVEGARIVRARVE